MDSGSLSEKPCIFKLFLSIPLNGFIGFFTPLAWSESELSIPLNGFGASFTPQGYPEKHASNFQFH